MMRVRHALKKRLGSAMIAAIMIFSLLPVSAITLAAETKAVSIKWTVRPQEGDGRGEVTLNAALRPDQETGPAAVMIELSLNAEEAAALEWNERIPEAMLTGNGGNDQGNIPEGGTSPSEGPDQGETPDGTTPDGTTPDGTTPDGTTPDSTTPSRTGEDVTGTGDPADTELEPTQTLSLLHNDAGTSGAQAVLIEKTDGSGAVLRILLVGESTYTESLAFAVTGGDSLEVNVDELDVRMQSYDADSLPQIDSAPLLEAGGFSDFSFEPLALTVLKTLPQEITIHAGAGGEESGSISLDGEGSKEIPFEIALKKLPVDVGQEKTYPFTLTWPSQLTRPAGALTISGPADDSGMYTILCGDQSLATLTLPEGVTPSGLTAVDSGLTVTLSLAAEAEAADVTLTVDGGAFERSSGAFSEPMTLSTVNSGGEAVSGSVKMTSGETSLPGDQDGYEVTVLEETNLSQTVAWADNNNTDKLRPEYGRDTFYPSLYFTINGVRTKLTEETFSTVGLEDWPDIQKTTDGFQLTDLPTKIQETDGFGGKQEYEVSWSLEPPAEPANYAFVEVTDDNLSQYPSVTETGWYYMQQGTFTFILEARMGETTSLTEAQIRKILSNFGFQWKYGTTTGSDSIRNMIENGYAEPPTVAGGTVTISGLWKYNLDGTPITFSVEELTDEGSGSGKLTEDELSGSGLLEEGSGDWFQILCDNSGVPNHSTDTDAVYNGGKLRLVLSGEKIFSAEKRWLDDAPAGEGLETRPDVTFTLWRYREGQAYNTAAQVAEVSTVKIEDTDTPQKAETAGDDTGVTETYYYYSVYFDQTTAGQSLPKYDADGYKYIYGVKEEMTKEPEDNNYETLYGVVGDNDQIETGSDTVPYGTRASGDTMLYSGGTLSNRLKDTVQVTAAKRWEAAAYQSEFGDVAVELTLQRRPVGGNWADVTDDDGNAVKCYLYSFTAERLSESYTTYRPEYDAQGHLLEYRWVETAVYQGVTATTEAEVREQIAAVGQPDSTVKACPITEGADGTRTFTLTQGTEPVAYFSTIESDGTIVNRVDDAIDYHVVKEWRPETLPKKEVTINLYRVDSGSADMELTTPYVSFSFDDQGKLKAEKTTVPKDSGITVTQDQKGGSEDPWHATVYGLPRFDENGRPYEYILLEQENFPEYVTKRLENGDYETTVINGEGGAAIPILVRKVWMDDGDDLHREPVTFTVYNARTNQPVQQSGGDPLTVTLENGLWHQVVKVPMNSGISDVNDVYVVETSMGSGADAETVEHHLNGEYTKEALYTTGKGDGGAIFNVTTENHRYQVTYKMELTATSGVEGTFTVTNRRLGNIDMTVNKFWVDGDEGAEAAKQKIARELEKIYKESDPAHPTQLALVFKLKFADKDKADELGWEITSSGIDSQTDTVQVGGGEKVPIYGQDSLTQVSSEQLIIGVNKDGQPEISDHVYFFNLPKYDINGQAVEYTVEEVWLDVTGTDTTKPPTELTKEALKRMYPDLYELWKDYTATYKMTYVTDAGHQANTKDTMTLDVTNTRGGGKDVVWYKEWKDDFTYDSDLRPDIYLDVYRVIHVKDETTGEVKKQVEQVQADVKWTEANSSNWTVTLPGVLKYDDLGYEIFYYAVERTVAAVGDFDYQAVKYSLEETDLGTRDQPVVNEDDPEQDAVQSGRVLDLLDETQWENETVPDSVKNGIGTFEEGGSPQYALIENGTFTNTLAENYTIEGMKYWSSLPSGWLEKMSLPAVTFNVYRASTGVPDTSGEPVATLTVGADQWQALRSGLGYRYLIWYEGVNTLSVDAKGNLTCTGQEGENRLPRYDEHGKLYTYVVKESIDWTGVAVADGDKVFTTSYSDFTVTNQYDPTRGSIQVKKFLYLPMTTGADGDSVPEAYPAVTFQLTRQVKIAGDYQNDDTFAPKTAVLTSAQVQSIWDGTAAAGGTLVDSGKDTSAAPAYIWATLQFDGLPLYAPDGNEYQYTVTEIKTELLGYDTWAQAGNVTNPDSEFTPEAKDKVSVSGLTPKKSDDPDAGIPQVSFKNQQPKDETTFDVLMATKVWEDFNDQFKFRPTQEKFEALLTLTRRANSQSGQNNAIAEQEVAFTVEWTAEKGNKTWTFNIKPADGTTGGFEKYAPNGMPWIYTLSERVTEDGKRLQLENDPTADANNVYTPNRTKGQWATVSGSGTNSNFGSLTNSVLTQAQYTKTWEDADGQPITEDYLGFDLTVEFQLQVSERGKDNWTAASENPYVMEAMGSGFTGTATLTGRVNAASRWSDSFKNLPAVVAKTENGATTYIFLTYRVIETKVSYGGTEQTIPWNGSSYGDPGTGLVTGAEFSPSGTNSVSTNTLATRELSAEKVWVDGNNQYNTRPGVVLPMTWTTWFVLQRTTGNPADETAVWENVDVVKLYGGNGSSKAEAVGTSEYWTHTFSGLPTADYGAGGATYTYRVRELQPKADGYTLPADDAAVTAAIVQPGGTFNPAGGTAGGSYTTSYGEGADTVTVTNALDTFEIEETPGKIVAVKSWAVPSGDTTVKPTVTFTLQYRTKGSAEPWKPWVANATKTATESGGWRVIWENLPENYSGAAVEYQVVETMSGSAASDWMQSHLDTVVTLEGEGEDAVSVFTFTFTNTPKVSYQVEKKWNPAGADTYPVTLGLYRTTDVNSIGLTTGTPVPVKELEPGGAKRTVTLTASPWTYTFTELPQYDPSGNRYYYYALELSGNTPVADGGSITLAPTGGGTGDIYVVTYRQEGGTKTIVTNTTDTSLTGTKTWKDGGNEGGTRPADLTLTLQRRISGGSWTTVTGVTPTWDKTTGPNTWTYTYTGLPTHDGSGRLYTYRVVETVPDGYRLENQAAGETAGAVAADAGGSYHFTNVRTGAVSLYVTKTWTEGTGAQRPTAITLKLERKLVTDPDTAWTDVTASYPQPTWTEVNENTWSLVYENLPRFNGEGVRYQYRITEDGVPVGYEKKDSANTDPTQGYALENIQRGALKISKQVSGNSGETGRSFRFTVTLTGASLAGTPAADVTGISYTAAFTSAAGTVTEKQLAFTGGVSETITLKHGESVIISGLPAGLSYSVTETEANTEGYTTTGSGWTGTIPVGGTAWAAFENYRHSGGGGGDPDDRVTISGTKTWVDRSDAEGKRPADLELTLYRSVSGGEEVVVNATPVWTKNGNVWTYTYPNLPKFDSSGNRYTYRVTETVPDEYVGKADGYNFTNTLAEELITLTGQKHWVGDKAEDRPDSITVVLYADGLVVRRVTVTAAEDWRYVFEDVPRYDADGKEIQYYVREEGVPAGYETQYSGLDITNKKAEAFGGLQITKQVTGSGAEYDRGFSFTVTLSDPSVNGTYGDLTFVNGVASLTLKHGQSAVAVGLPAGITYTVTETVPEGYVVSGSNQTGVIVQDTLAAVTVINTREIPETPQEPGDPGTPENPEGPEVPTGDPGSLTLLGVLTALFAGGLLATLFLGGTPFRKKSGKRLTR